MESKQQKQKRLENNNESKEKRLLNENNSEKQNRLAKANNYKKEKRSVETDNQRQSRLESNRLSETFKTGTSTCQCGSTEKQSWAKTNINKFHKSLQYNVCHCKVCHEA